MDAHRTQLQPPIPDTNPCNESIVDELRLEEDRDYVLQDISRLPFRIARVLGGGHSAIVEKVQDKWTGKVFAKKTIRFPQARLRAQKEEHFNNEVNIIRSLKNHHHIIRVYATYVAKREFGLILQPAADEGSLEDYLGNYLDKLEQPGSLKEEIDLIIPSLEKAFGCLASGLAFIHGKGIRHKDIKPQNILVHRGSVLYTDFGSSKDANQPGESTTEGLPDFLTRRYSPPEVLAHTKRNYGADVYSLGCVYVELIRALMPNIQYDEERWFSDIMDHVHQELSSAAIPPRWSFIPTIITAMTLTDREKCPAAGRIYSEFSGHAGFLCVDCYHKFETAPWTAKTGLVPGIKSNEVSLTNVIPTRISFDQNMEKTLRKPKKGILKPSTKLFPFMGEVDGTRLQSSPSFKIPVPPPPPSDEAPPSLSLFDDSKIMAHEYLREAAQWIHTKFIDALAEFVDQVAEVKQARLNVQEKRQDLHVLHKRVSRYEMMLINSVRNSLSTASPLETKRLTELSEAAKDVRDLLQPFDLEYERLEVELGAKEYKLNKKYAQIEDSFQQFFKLTVNPSPPPSVPSRIEYEETSSETTSDVQLLLSAEPKQVRLFHGALIGPEIDIGQVPKALECNGEEEAERPQLRDTSSAQNRFHESQSFQTASKEQLSKKGYSRGFALNAQSPESQERQKRLNQDLLGLATHATIQITEATVHPFELSSGIDYDEANELLLHGMDRRSQSELSKYLTNFKTTQDRVDNWLLHKLRVSRHEIHALRRCSVELSQEGH